jgi:1-acyl-sn-glycerol-3-phosphate acyltransferase
MDEWHYEPTEDFGQGPIERLEHFPRHPDLPVYIVRWAANVVIRVILRLYHRLRIIGREHLPAGGSFVLVANHASHLDTAALLAALPLRRIHHAFPAAARDYFFTNLPKITFSAVVMNAMPFDRKDNPRQSLDVSRQMLDAPGHVLILFPEGTRSLDGEIGRFKAGIGYLTAGTEHPVVPCYLDGAGDAWPKGAWFPRPRRLKLTIGEPLRFRELSPTKEDAIRIAGQLREAVLQLQERSLEGDAV